MQYEVKDKSISRALFAFPIDYMYFTKFPIINRGTAADTRQLSRNYSNVKARFYEIKDRVLRK